MTLAKLPPIRARPFARKLFASYFAEMQSQAHATFLKAHFGAKVRLVNPDGNDEIEIQEYNTSSKVTTKELLKEMNKHKA